MCSLPLLRVSQLTFPRSDDWDNPDRVQYGTKSGIGAASTFNHLTDAILDVAATRAMYMRRLRTLADKYYGQDKLRQVSLVFQPLACCIAGSSVTSQELSRHYRAQLAVTAEHAHDTTVVSRPNF